jgi:hypothetical protein
MRKRLHLVAPACLAALSLFTPPATRAQDGAKPAAGTRKPDAPKPQPAKVDEKAQAVLARAVEALGGAAYLGVRTVVSQGYYTQFREGVGGIPSTFRDYMVFPDRERTEFKGVGGRSVQVNTGDTGWLFDARKKALTEVTPEQAADFRTVMRTSVDNVLRGWWRAEGATLSYVGRREAGLARRNEVVKLSYTDGFEVEFEFDAREGLPSKVVYRRPNAEGETVEEEDRYAQFLSVGAVRFPYVIDHYRAGVQTSRVNYDKVEVNAAVPDSLFAKPADVKSIKF